MAHSRTPNRFLFWVVIIGLAGRAAWAATDDTIPGVSLPSSPVSGSLNQASDYDDVYSVNLKAGQMLIAAITGPTNSQYDLYLYPPGSTKFSDPFVAYAEQQYYPNRFCYVVPANAAGTYYLDAYCESGTGAYVITYSIVTASSDDTIPGVSIGSSPVTGKLDENKDIDDIYRISLTAGQVLYASITGTTDTLFDVFLFPPTATDVNSDQTVAIDFRESYPFLLRYTVPSGLSGNYYLDTYCAAGTGSYTITYKIVAGGADDVFPGIALGPSPVSGSLNIDSDYQDLHAVNLYQGQKISVSLTGASGTDFDLLLFPPGTVDSAAGEQVAGSFKTSYPETIAYTVPAGKSGKYYVAARAYGGSGSYQLTYSIVTVKNSVRSWMSYQ
ncbi:hypothetical protein LLG95_00470 [bacterium]|nr:hypothetical protein [bacterium]